MLYKNYYIIPFRDHYLVVDGMGRKIADVYTIQDGRDEIDEIKGGK